MSDKVESIQWTPLVFNSADWDLVLEHPFWHSFHYDWEVGRQIKQKMSKRGNVWGIGLWPDAETEKVARQCAEIFEEQFSTRDPHGPSRGLRSSPIEVPMESILKPSGACGALVVVEWLRSG